MMFYKIEYPIEEKVDDILAWLEKDMRIIQDSVNGKVRVAFQCQREGNVVTVSHTVYEPKELAEESRAIKAAKKYLHKEFEETEDSLLLRGKSFSFEIQRVTDTSLNHRFISREKFVY